MQISFLRQRSVQFSCTYEVGFLSKNLEKSIVSLQYEERFPLKVPVIVVVPILDPIMSARSPDDVVL